MGGRGWGFGELGKKRRRRKTNKQINQPKQNCKGFYTCELRDKRDADIIILVSVSVCRSRTISHCRILSVSNP